MVDIDLFSNYGISSSETGYNGVFTTEVIAGYPLTLTTLFIKLLSYSKTLVFNLLLAAQV